MKCPPKVLCLTFGGHFIMTKGSIYFFELPPKIPFLPVWYCFSDAVPHSEEDSGFSKRAATKAFCEASFM